MSVRVGARIRRVDHPLAELLTLEIASGEREVLLLCVSAGLPSLGLVPDRPRGRPIDAFGALLRRVLEGGTIVAHGIATQGAYVTVDGPEGQVTVEAIAAREARGFRLLDAQGQVRHASARGLPTLGASRAADDLNAAGRAMRDALLTRAIESRRAELRRAIDRAIDRRRRTIAAVEGDAARGEAAATLRHEADLLMSLPPDAAREGQAIVALDWALDPPAPRAIAIDPRRSPREDAAHRYHRARKLERGVAIALERWERLARELEAIEAIARALSEADDADDLDAIEAAIAHHRVAPANARDPRAQAGARLPYRAFVSERGLPIWVGRGAADNDTLTVRLAKPHHLFLHARGRTGAHVIIPLEKGAICDEATLADAATLAAHFSDARGEDLVEVTHAERRHVRKPRGSAIGAVRVDREKTLLLRLEPGRLARLLASEGEPPSKRKRPREP